MMIIYIFIIIIEQHLFVVVNLISFKMPPRVLLISLWKGPNNKILCTMCKTQRTEKYHSPKKDLPTPRRRVSPAAPAASLRGHATRGAGGGRGGRGVPRGARGARPPGLTWGLFGIGP